MARLRHSYFADYYKRFGYEKEDIYCKCSQNKSKDYLFSYSSTRTLRVKLFNVINKRFFI